MSELAVEGDSNTRIAAAYRASRERIAQLVGDLDGAASAIAVPACPGWSVHDVIAHCSGGVADAIAGRMEGAGTDAWTARQVAERRGWTTETIIDEWSENATMVEPLMDDAGLIGWQAVADVVSHEHDIRSAIGKPGARDSDGVRIALRFVADRLIESGAEKGLSLRVRTTDGETFGSHDAELTLRGERFELLRAITGRRSVGQIRELEWSGNCEPALRAFWWYSLQPAQNRINE